MSKKGKTLDEQLAERRRLVLEQAQPEVKQESWTAHPGPEPEQPVELQTSNVKQEHLTELLGFRVTRQMKLWFLYQAGLEGKTISGVLEEMMLGKYGEPPRGWEAPSYLAKRPSRRRR
ncbi:hypothetical protein [Deinococcus roseus]|uniref:Uncharacterized protein n=1 Tax=Deinococcus roseus TaxID=392414 RepID=A0ABQ2DHW9_9DEIO|nr:hypothetical protein [Deinococcus roseus]GGJ58317.1 hypothetical protein GCM10008938_50510 [Deinococcus roseus]